MATLFPPTPAFDLPLTIGQDLVVTFARKQNNALLDFDPGTTVTLIIDSTPAISAIATITGAHAVCRVDSDQADKIEPYLTWRCRITLPGATPINIVPVNGQTKRYDGLPT